MWASRKVRRWVIAHFQESTAVVVCVLSSMLSGNSCFVYTSSIEGWNLPLGNSKFRKLSTLPNIFLKSRFKWSIFWNQIKAPLGNIFFISFARKLPSLGGGICLCIWQVNMSFLFKIFNIAPPTNRIRFHTNYPISNEFRESEIHQVGNIAYTMHARCINHSSESSWTPLAVNKNVLLRA